jgi:hypothetical protein
LPNCVCWASRFAPYGRSRRAIRSITFTAFRYAHAVRWFRYYPSRCARFAGENMKYEILKYLCYLCA